MTQIEILNSGYAWNWLHTLNRFLDGFAWGLGLVVAILIFSLYVRAVTKDKKGMEKDTSAEVEP